LPIEFLTWLGVVWTG